MAYPYSGRAIFSTHNGQYARRQAVPGMRVIIRSSAEKDRDTMRDRLRQKYPEFCKAITTPVTNVDEYFDGYDLEAHGIEFLRAVLESIGSVNAVHTMKVQDYAHRWRAANAATYLGIVSGHAVMDIFTKEDVEEYGHDFLTDTMVYIKHLKAQEDNGCMILLPLDHIIY